MSKHILVADDDAHIRDVISFALEKAGMRVILAEDGRQALEQFHTQRISWKQQAYRNTIRCANRYTGIGCAELCEAQRSRTMRLLASAASYGRDNSAHRIAVAVTGRPTKEVGRFRAANRHFKQASNIAEHYGFKAPFVVDCQGKSTIRIIRHTAI